MTFGVRKLESLGYHVALFADPTFSHFDTMPACDTQTDRHTHTHTLMANTRAELTRVGKNYQLLTVGRTRSVELCHSAKFRGDRSNCCRDIEIFVFSKDSGRPPCWICNARV